MSNNDTSSKSESAPLNLNGQDDFIQIENVTVTNDLNGLTITAWVNPDYSSGSLGFTVLSKEKSFSLTIANNIHPKKIAKFSVFDGIKWTTVESTSIISEGWSFLSSTFDGESIGIFVNGTREGTQNIDGIPTLTTDGKLETTAVENITSEEDIIIGASLTTKNEQITPNNQFSGEIDDVLLYDYVLDDELIYALYEQTKNDYALPLPLSLEEILAQIIEEQSFVANVTTLANVESTLHHDDVEIGKSVTWEQVISLDNLENIEDIIIELPDDAENIVVNLLNNNTEIISDDDGDNMMAIAPLDLASMEQVDEIVQENKDTKLLVINQTATEYLVTFTTPSPYTVESDQSTSDIYNKLVTVKHDSTLHYANVTSYTDIPEEFVLEGIEFQLFWMVDGNKINIIDDPIFNVEFVDTDANGLADRLEWTVPQLSEQEFVIESKSYLPSANVSSKLEAMKNKLDSTFYKKTLEMLNAKASGKLDHYLALSRINSTDVDSLPVSVTTDYYDVIITVPKYAEQGKILHEQNDLVKDTIEQELFDKYDARSVYKAEVLSFVVASIPVTKISKLVESQYAVQIGDGEGKIIPLLDGSKSVINAQPGVLMVDGSGVRIAVLDSGVSHDDLPEGTTVISHAICEDNSTPCTQQAITTPINHGTQVAGVIASTGASMSSHEGVAPGSDIIDLQIGKSHPDDFAEGPNQWGTGAFTLAMDYALRHGANIINLSVGFPNSTSDCTSATSDTFSAIVDETVDQGVFIVGAVGNQGFTLRTVVPPHCAENSLEVGSISFNDANPFDASDYLISPTSSHGPTPDGRLKPEIVAPGVDINMPLGGTSYDLNSGTSFASPHVAGVSSLVLSRDVDAFPQLTPRELKAALLVGAQWDPLELITQPMSSAIYETLPGHHLKHKTEYSHSTLQFQTE